MFQFHTGSIRSAVSVGMNDVIVGFNSTLVRLEVCLETWSVAFAFGFNSTLVRLEAAFIVSRHTVALNGFNSTLVRLEGAPVVDDNPYGFGFNSTLVRLEAFFTVY